MSKRKVSVEDKTYAVNLYLDGKESQGFYRYLNVAALPCSLIPTPLDDEQSPGIFHLQEDFE